MILHYIDLYFGIDLRSVVLAIYFWFTLYNHVPVIRYGGLP